MAKIRSKGRKKLTRSGRDKAYYERQYRVTAHNKARRAEKREKNIAAAKAKRAEQKSMKQKMLWALHELLSLISV